MWGYEAVEVSGCLPMESSWRWGCDPERALKRRDEVGRWERFHFPSCVDPLAVGDWRLARRAKPTYNVRFFFSGDALTVQKPVTPESNKLVVVLLLPLCSTSDSSFIDLMSGAFQVSVRGTDLCH